MARRTPEEGRVDVRKPPTEAVFVLHLPRKEGKCDWCGLPCDERTPVRKKIRPRHAACEREWLIIIRPDHARDAVFKRDHGICCDCGEDWSNRVRFRPEYKNRIEDGASKQDVREGDRWNGKVLYTVYSNPIIWVSLWHVDHKIPLWKVRHMPPLERLQYFKLANLVTRCEPCHKIKTRREAAEKAKFDDQADLLISITKPKPPGKWGSRKMQSGNRFPPKGSRPMRGKKR